MLKVYAALGAIWVAVSIVIGGTSALLDDWFGPDAVLIFCAALFIAIGVIGKIAQKRGAAPQNHEESP